MDSAHKNARAVIVYLLLSCWFYKTYLPKTILSSFAHLLFYCINPKTLGTFFLEDDYNSQKCIGNVQIMLQGHHVHGLLLFFVCHRIKFSMKNISIAYSIFVFLQQPVTQEVGCQCDAPIMKSVGVQVDFVPKRPKRRSKGNPVFTCKVCVVSPV